MQNIRELFPEFFQDPLDKKDLKTRSGNIIILDTNYLLEIIKSPVKISDTYVKALERVKENIYIPYLVALEFNFNKSKIKKSKIKNTRDYKEKIKKSINKLEENIRNIDFLNEEAKKDFTKSLTDITNKYFNEITQQIETNFQTILTDEQDILYDRLIEVIKHNVGKPYKQEWINEVQSEGEERYNNNIPPGFNDKAKSDSDNASREYNEIKYLRKYGDLIIWKDILEFSKQNNNKGKKVIFVTNDGTSKNKNDFLYKINDLTVGPHIFLMNELQKEAKKELHILNNLRFIQLVNDLSDSELTILQETLDHQENNIKHRDKKLYTYRFKASESEKELYNEQKVNKTTRRSLAQRSHMQFRLADFKQNIEQIENALLENEYHILKIQKLQNDNNFEHDEETSQAIEFELKQLFAKRKELDYELMGMNNSYYDLKKYLDSMNNMED